MEIVRIPLKMTDDSGERDRGFRGNVTGDSGVTCPGDSGERDRRKCRVSAVVVVYLDRSCLSTRAALNRALGD